MGSKVDDKRTRVLITDSIVRIKTLIRIGEKSSRFVVKNTHQLQALI
jgi:hypothetical protein